MKANQTYELIFSEQMFQEGEIRLLELPNKDFLSNFSKKDEDGFPMVSIKGSNTSEAVLCDGENTYTMKLAETSNTNLLINPMKQDEKTITASAQLFSLLELYKASPNFQELLNLLSKSPYKGREYETESSQKYSMKDLKALVPASDKELKEKLVELAAIEIGGFWRLVEPSYYEEIFSQILNACVAEELSFSDINPKSILKNLDQYEDFLVLHVLHSNGKKNEKGNYVVQEAKIRQFKALEVLKTHKNLSFDSFLEKWRDSLPQGIDTSFDDSVVKGIALIETGKAFTQVISLFPEASLSSTPSLRFKQLFSRKQRWKFEEISPYLDAIRAQNETAEQLLLKYAVIDRADKNQIWITQRY